MIPGYANFAFFDGFQGLFLFLFSERICLIYLKHIKIGLRVGLVVKCPTKSKTKNVFGYFQYRILLGTNEHIKNYQK